MSGEPERTTGRGPLPGRRFLVAIHDVTPAHHESLKHVYSLLQRLNISRYALLVVPDWHGQWPLHRDTGFVDDLLARQAGGGEIFLHGFRHDEVGFSRTFMQRLRVAGRTAASAEFRIAPPGEVEKRLDRGLEMFERLGLKPVGFVPPAWLAGSGLEQQLRQRKLNVTEGFWVISNLATGRRLFAPALSWSTARSWRSRLTAAIASARSVVEHPRAVVRVAIHPPDIQVPVVERSVQNALQRLAERRVGTTYREAVAATGRSGE